MRRNRSSATGNSSPSLCTYDFVLARTIKLPLCITLISIKRLHSKQLLAILRNLLVPEEFSFTASQLGDLQALSDKPYLN
jgi:hypothetical protein